MYAGFNGAKVNIAYEQITETPVLNVVMTDKKWSPFSESLSMNFNNLLAKYLLLLDLQRPESNSVYVCICAREMLFSYLYY